MGVVVFGFMFYAIGRHRRSAGHRAKQFRENMLVQIMWTVIPVLIVAGLAFPATRTVFAMKDTSSPDITIKVTGYQWKLRYDYLGENVFFYSQLSTPRDQIENRAQKRSEEHTSELQSHLNLVCRLLLEKKKHTSELQSHLNLVCRLLLEKKK